MQLQMSFRNLSIQI